MNPKNFMYAVYGLIGVILISVGSNAYQAHKLNNLSETIQKQIKGELTETARLISQSREEINAVRSSMLTERELSNRVEAILGGLGKDTRESIERFQQETGARIDSISVRISSMETRLKGQARVGSEKAPPPSPPPTSWKGVTKEDASRCVAYPDLCDPLEFSWATPYGKPLASFTSDNIWSGEYNLDLSLEFKAVVIEYAEDQSNLGAGAVRNQGLHIMAGYTNAKGEFVTIAEDKLVEGNPNLDSRFFYVPKVAPSSIKTSLKLFEPSLLAGVSYTQQVFGFSVGASLLNLSNGEYRLGSQVVVTSKGLLLAGVLSYHPYLLGKHLNVAPHLGWAVGMDKSNSWLIGLSFQVW